MIKGGYQIIDFTGISALDGTESIPGAFNKIKNSGKPVMAQNLLGSVAFTHDANPSDTSVAILPVTIYSGGSLTTIGITISSDDKIEILS